MKMPSWLTLMALFVAAVLVMLVQFGLMNIAEAKHQTWEGECFLTGWETQGAIHAVLQCGDQTVSKALTDLQYAVLKRVPATVTCRRYEGSIFHDSDWKCVVETEKSNG